MENQLLDINGLDVHYRELQVLWDISLHVKENSIVTLVGSNGAGKTTLLSAISGRIIPSKGEIYFAGKALGKLKPQEVTNIGISLVPEGRSLFANMTVMENLELGAYLPRVRKSFKKSLEYAFNLFPVLNSRKNQLAGSLSGGEQQMLSIARALMSKPRILMLDEPSLGLSPLVTKKMFELIDILKKQGMTILLVEQNIYQALKIADYAYVIKMGKIVVQGEGKELLARPDVKKYYIAAME